MTRRIGLFFIKLCEHIQLYTWTIWIIRFRSLEILYYKFKIKQTSTDIPTDILKFAKYIEVFFIYNFQFNFNAFKFLRVFSDISFILFVKFLFYLINLFHLFTFFRFSG